MRVGVGEVGVGTRRVSVSGRECFLRQRSVDGNRAAEVSDESDLAVKRNADRRLVVHAKLGLRLGPGRSLAGFTGGSDRSTNTDDKHTTDDDS